MREIPLVNGQGVVLVDDEDFERFASFLWFRNSTGYATCRNTTPTGATMLAMHRLVMGTASGD
jgi:hypothetical protein